MMSKQMELKSYYKWLVVLTAFYGMSLNAGCLIYSSGLFIKPLQAYFGWERGTIAFAFTLQFLFLALFSPLTGKAVDKFGAKIVFITGAVIAAIGFLMMPLVKTPAQFYLINIFVGMAEAAIGPVPCTGAVSPLFDKKRGLAIGVMSTGVGFGGFFISILVGTILIPSHGWQGGYYGISAAHVILIPLAMLIKSKKNQMIAGIEKTTATTKIKTNEWGNMLRSPALWIISIIFFMFLSSLVGAVQVQAPHLQDIGFPVLVASSSLGYLALVSAAAKLFFGWLCDKIKPKIAYMLSAICLTSGLIMLLFFKHDSSSFYLWTYVLIFGISSYGLYFGVVSLVSTVGQAAGPLIAGLLFDNTGSYRLTFILFICLTIASIPIAAFIRKKPSEEISYDPESLENIKPTTVKANNRVPSLG